MRYIPLTFRTLFPEDRTRQVWFAMVDWGASTYRTSGLIDPHSFGIDRPVIHSGLSENEVNVTKILQRIHDEWEKFRLKWIVEMDKWKHGDSYTSRQEEKKHEERLLWYYRTWWNFLSNVRNKIDIMRRYRIDVTTDVYLPPPPMSVNVGAMAADFLNLIWSGIRTFERRNGMLTWRDGKGNAKKLEKIQEEIEMIKGDYYDKIRPEYERIASLKIRYNIAYVKFKEIYNQVILYLRKMENKFDIMEDEDKNVLRTRLNRERREHYEERKARFLTPYIKTKYRRYFEECKRCKYWIGNIKKEKNRVVICPKVLDPQTFSSGDEEVHQLAHRRNPVYVPLYQGCPGFKVAKRYKQDAHPLSVLERRRRDVVLWTNTQWRNIRRDYPDDDDLIEPLRIALNETYDTIADFLWLDKHNIRDPEITRKIEQMKRDYMFIIQKFRRKYKQDSDLTPKERLRQRALWERRSKILGDVLKWMNNIWNEISTNFRQTPEREELQNFLSGLYDELSDYTHKNVENLESIEVIRKIEEVKRTFKSTAKRWLNRKYLRDMQYDPAYENYEYSEQVYLVKEHIDDEFFRLKNFTILDALIADFLAGLQDIMLEILSNESMTIREIFNEITKSIMKFVNAYNDKKDWPAWVKWKHIKDSQPTDEERDVLQTTERMKHRLLKYADDLFKNYQESPWGADGKTTAKMRNALSEAWIKILATHFPDPYSDKDIETRRRTLLNERIIWVSWKNEVKRLLKKGENLHKSKHRFWIGDMWNRDRRRWFIECEQCKHFSFNKENPNKHVLCEHPDFNSSAFRHKRYTNKHEYRGAIYECPGFEVRGERGKINELRNRNRELSKKMDGNEDQIITIKETGQRLNLEPYYDAYFKRNRKCPVCKKGRLHSLHLQGWGGSNLHGTPISLHDKVFEIEYQYDWDRKKEPIESFQRGGEAYKQGKRLYNYAWVTCHEFKLPLKDLLRMHTFIPKSEFEKHPPDKGPPLPPGWMNNRKWDNEDEDPRVYDVYNELVGIMAVRSQRWRREGKDPHDYWGMKYWVLIGMLNEIRDDKSLKTQDKINKMRKLIFTYLSKFRAKMEDMFHDKVESSVFEMYMWCRKRIQTYEMKYKIPLKETNNVLFAVADLGNDPRIDHHISITRMKLLTLKHLAKWDAKYGKKEDGYTWTDIEHYIDYLIRYVLEEWEKLSKKPDFNEAEFYDELHKIKWNTTEAEDARRQMKAMTSKLLARWKSTPLEDANTRRMYRLGNPYFSKEGKPLETEEEIKARRKEIEEENTQIGQGKKTLKQYTQQRVKYQTKYEEKWGNAQRKMGEGKSLTPCESCKAKNLYSQHSIWRNKKRLRLGEKKIHFLFVCHKCGKFNYLVGRDPKIVAFEQLQDSSDEWDPGEDAYNLALEFLDIAKDKWRLFVGTNASELIPYLGKTFEKIRQQVFDVTHEVDDEIYDYKTEKDALQYYHQQMRKVENIIRKFKNMILTTPKEDSTLSDFIIFYNEMKEELRQFSLHWNAKVNFAWYEVRNLMEEADHEAGQAYQMVYDIYDKLKFSTAETKEQIKAEIEKLKQEIRKTATKIINKWKSTYIVEEK